MNCLLYCIIYDLLSLPSRPSLEARRWRRGGTVEEGWRPSISIIFFHCGSFSPTPFISCSISPLPAHRPSWCFFSAAPTPSPPPSLEGNAAFPHVVLLLKQRRNEIMPSEGGGGGGGCSQGSFYSASVRTFLWRFFCGGDRRTLPPTVGSWNQPKRNASLLHLRRPSHRSWAGQQAMTNPSTVSTLQIKFLLVEIITHFSTCPPKSCHTIWRSTCYPSVLGRETKWIQEAQTNFGDRRRDHSRAGVPASSCLVRWNYSVILSENTSRTTHLL